MAEFKDLRVKSLMMDDIMAQPDTPDKAFVIDFETRSLRDARHLLISNRIPDAMQFIEDNSHPVCEALPTLAVTLLCASSRTKV